MAKLTDEYIQARIAGNDKVEKAYIDANGDAVIFAADGFGWDCGDMPLATIDLIPTAKGAKHFNLSLDLLRPIAAAEVAEMTEEEMQKYQDDFKAAIVDLEAALNERNSLNAQLAGATAEHKAREEAHEAQLRSLQDAKEALAQKQFLERAEARFRQSEEEMQKYQDDCEGDAKAQTMKEENDDA